MDLCFSLPQLLPLLSVVSGALRVERQSQQGSDNDGEIDGNDRNDDSQLSTETEAVAVAVAVAMMKSLVVMTRAANLCCSSSSSSSSSSGGEGQSSSATSAAASLQQLMNLPRKQRHGMVRGLRNVLDGVIHNRRHDVYEFYSLWREWIWLLILSGPDCIEGGGAAMSFSASSSSSRNHYHCLQPSLMLTPCQVFGWEMVELVINSSARHRPPPRAYHVKGAGCAIVNGLYMYTGPLTPEGYALIDGTNSGNNNNDDDDNDNDDDADADADADEDDDDDDKGPSKIKYQRIVDLKVPTEVNGEAESIGDDKEVSKTLTICHCVLRTNRKRWFLSEMDEQQPGTDLDVDYYANAIEDRSSRRRRNNDVHPLASQLPPTNDWMVTKRVVGPAPPPSHAAHIGAMVPPGQEFSTLEHQLARWMLQRDLLPMAMQLARRHPIIAHHYLPLVMRFGAVTMFELDLVMNGWEAEERSSSHCQGYQKASANANLGTQFIFDLARMSLFHEEGDKSSSHGWAALTGGETEGAAAPAEEKAVATDQRVNAIAVWLRNHVLDGPTSEETQQYAQVLVGLGLDSVEAVMTDLHRCDVETMQEITGTFKVFHRRRLSSMLRECQR